MIFCYSSPNRLRYGGVLLYTLKHALIKYYILKKNLGKYEKYKECNKHRILRLVANRRNPLKWLALTEKHVRKGQCKSSWNNEKTLKRTRSAVLVLYGLLVPVSSFCEILPFTFSSSDWVDAGPFFKMKNLEKWLLRSCILDIPQFCNLHHYVMLWYLLIWSLLRGLYFDTSKNYKIKMVVGGPVVESLSCSVG